MTLASVLRFSPDITELRQALGKRPFQFIRLADLGALNALARQDAFLSKHRSGQLKRAMADFLGRLHGYVRLAIAGPRKQGLGFPLLMNLMLIPIVAILTISVVPLYAQEQRPNAEKLKADAEDVFKIISGDKLKIRTYCEIADLSVQLAQASRKQDTKKIEKLAQNIDELESKLGPEYPALLDGLWKIDPTSHDAKEIGSILNKLDAFCGN